MSRRIILLAHGSSDKRWCETFEGLAQPTLDAVPDSLIAYMELASPSLQSVISDAAKEGVTEFSIIPLFLAAGRHLRKDVPAMIRELEQSLGVTIDLGAPVGENPLLGCAIRDLVQQQVSS